MSYDNEKEKQIGTLESSRKPICPVCKKPCLSVHMYDNADKTEKGKLIGIAIHKEHPAKYGFGMMVDESCTIVKEV